MDQADFTTNFEEVRDFLAAQTFSLWMMSYGLTHGQLILAVFTDNCLDRREIFCRECFYIQGPTQGGPYRLKVERTLSDKDDDIVIIEDENGELRVECLYVRLM